ncbi:MAG: hypothetical protein AB1401_06200 [Thermodesulfobacteriota bacterium]
MIRLLTEEIILNLIEDVYASSESEEMKQAQLAVLHHCLDCLEKGEMLTIDSEERIKLHETGLRLH